MHCNRYITHIAYAFVQTAYGHWLDTHTVAHHNSHINVIELDIIS
jgi:hypothetical protein